MIKKEEIFIIDGVRTPTSIPSVSLKEFSAARLSAITIETVLKRNKISAELVDEVIIGSAVSAGSGQNLSRQAALKASLPSTVPAMTINNVCGSGMQSIILAAQSIVANNSNFIVAGGAESASQNPLIVKKRDPEAVSFKDLKDSLLNDGLWCTFTNSHMGDLAESLAKEHKITREAQDQYTLLSHQKACRAQKDNKFSKSIVPVRLKSGKMFLQDDHPRRNLDLEKLSFLPSAFKKEGTVTAGNSSLPCDGAGSMLVASGQFIKKNKITPRAKIISYATVATNPELTFTAAVLAIEKSLKRAKLSIDNIDLFEIGEAFASQAIYTQKKLNIPDKKLNIFGGDLAIGHPLGAAGTRLMISLLHALKDQKKKRGMAAICLGGGGAVAVVIESVS